jgi:hypothetical protein
MELGGPNDEFLLAGGLTGGGVAMLERIDGGSNLKVVARSTVPDAQIRTTFVWL